MTFTNDVINSSKHRIAFFVCVVSLSLLGGWVGTLAADREMPTIVYSAEPSKSIVPAGGELRIEYVVRRTRMCAVDVDRFIIDSDKVRFPLDDLQVRAGLALGEDRFIQPVKIPPEAVNGPATYKTISTYYCNPLQKLFPIQGGERSIHFVIQ